MKKQTIFAKDAPAAIGPYSHGCKFGDLVFTSGQLGINPATGVFGADIAEQAHLCFKNLKTVLEAGGSRLENCVKVTVYIKDMNEFAKVNGIYGEYFKSDFPARTCIEAARLPKDALIEIEAVAHC